MACAQSFHTQRGVSADAGPGEALTERPWREVVGSRLRGLAWVQGGADVRPFLEREEDTALLKRGKPPWPYWLANQRRCQGYRWKNASASALLRSSIIRTSDVLRPP